MKNLVYKATLLTLLGTTLFGCGKKEIVVKEAAIRPVKTMVIHNDQLGSDRNFPGRVDAVQRAQISFRVAGKLIKMHVKEGDDVKKGEILAELDPTDFKITLANRQASYNRTKADYTRGKELIKDGYISRTQFDKMESDFTTAKSNLNQAQQDLKYTQLKASFAGIIGKRYVENFEEVQAKQEIFNLSDVSQVEIKIDVPERLMRSAEKDKEKVEAFASFGGSAEKSFPLEFKEVAAKADQETQTFAVTFVMDQPQGLMLLPGMTANVRIEIHAKSEGDNYFLLPASAVKGASDMKPTIFVVDPQSSTLKAKTVKVGSMQGLNIQVIKGVEAGDRVVIAGISFMRDGDKVTVMQDIEQADPATAP